MTPCPFQKIPTCQLSCLHIHFIVLGQIFIPTIPSKGLWIIPSQKLCTLHDLKSPIQQIKLHFLSLNLKHALMFDWAKNSEGFSAKRQLSLNESRAWVQTNKQTHWYSIEILVDLVQTNNLFCAINGIFQSEKTFWGGGVSRGWSIKTRRRYMYIWSGLGDTIFLFSPPKLPSPVTQIRRALSS